MTNIKYTAAAVALIAALALSGTASAHDMDQADAGQHHHKMCKDAKPAMCHKGMRAEFRKDRVDFEKMRAVHEKMNAVLVAPAFDRKAFLALSGQMEQLRSQMEKRHAEAFANMAAKMSPEERARMAERFHGHGHEHGHEHGEEGGWQHHGEWSHAHSQNNQSHDWTPSSSQ